MASKFPIDTNKVLTAEEQLKTQLLSQVKQHIVTDSQGRVKFIFTAPIGAQANDPCTVTEYVYLNATSTIVIDRQERNYLWQAAWGSGFVFDPTVVYDADGNGVL